MTRLVLIEAAPTQWDADERLAGAHSFPLTDDARSAIQSFDLNTPIQSVYRAAQNEATDQAARIVAQRFRLRPRDNAALEEVNVGLWEGLKPPEIKGRFPSAYPRWRENAILVNPPEGESLPDAIARLHGALGQILRRNRGRTVALALRPMAMQIVIGLLRFESHEQIGGHLHNRCPFETIELSDEHLERLVS
jgi:broad specificity phosphatase PhoE